MRVSDRRLDFGRRRPLDRDERGGVSDPDVDGRGERVRCLGELPEHGERLLEERDRLAVRGAGRGSVARLAQVPDRLVAKLAAARVMGEFFDVLVEAIGVEPLDRADERRVQRAAAIAQQAPVGDLVRQRVLERVLELGEQARLVQELRRLQPRQPASHSVLVEVGNDQQQGERHVLADDGGGLEEPLVLAVQPVDPRGEDGLHRRRHADRVEGRSPAGRRRERR